MIESFLWYSRYSVWVGAIVLILQAITGRSVGVITLLAVLLLGLGFLAFIGVLSWEGLGLPLRFEPAVLGDEPAAVPEVSRQPATSARPRLRPLETKPMAAGVEAPTETPANGELDSPAVAPNATATPASKASVHLATQALTPDSPLAGASCSACAKRLQAGQVVVRCPDCGAVQHASCWTDNGFHCGVDDCAGRGSLEAPVGE